MHRQISVLAVAALLLVACGGRNTKAVESVGGRDVPGFELLSLQGTRDGDRLDVKAVFGDRGPDSIRVDFRFNIGSPTRLESGTWSAFGDTGIVRERSVTFLGGQNGPPSLGGRFDLLAPAGSPRYRITIPVQELKTKL